MSYKSDLDLLIPFQISYLKLSCNLRPLKPTPSHPPTTPAGMPSHTRTLALSLGLLVTQRMTPQRIPVPPGSLQEPESSESSERRGQAEAF